LLRKCLIPCLHALHYLGDYLAQCGNAVGKPRPTEFVSGTEKGGVYLNVWKREK
jgi:hypothetical protein